MDAASQAHEFSAVALTMAGVLARMAGAVGLSTLPIFPGLSIRIRLALVAALAVVAIPTAITAAGSAAVPSCPVPFFILGELMVGLAMGTAVALVISASAWAGGILGSVSGLSWADDFDPTSEAQTAGMARLAGWIGLSAFLVAGGQLGVVAGLIDSLHCMPIGTVLSANDPANDLLTKLAVTIPALALSLAVGIAMPALVAVLAFHLASAICLRTVAFTPGPGLLQALAALVLLGAVYGGAETWASGFSARIHRPIESCLTER